MAHAVASGSADAGLGIAVAARSQGLDFIALAQENYHLVCLKSALEKPATRALRALLRSAHWRLTRAPSLARHTRQGLEARMSRAANRLTAGFEYIGPAMDAKVARSMLLGG